MWGCCRRAASLDLSLKAVGAKRDRQFRVQHLQRHRPVVPEIVGQIDRGHAAPAQLALEAVTLG